MLGCTRRLAVVGFGLVLACGPQAAAVGGTEGDTGDATTSGESVPANPTAPAPTASTDPGNSGGAATSGGPGGDSSPTAADGGTTGLDDAGPETETDGSDGVASDTDVTDGESDGCPVGAEGCPCGPGGACDDGLMCDVDGRTCVTEACDPLDRADHDDEDSAYDLMGLVCNGAGPIDLGVAATLVGPQTDWYRFSGEAVSPCTEQPSASVTADIEVEVCVYIECVSGGVASPSCSGGAPPSLSPDGRVGCCGDQAAGMNLYSCSGNGGKDVDVWVSVETDERLCADYGLQYDY